MTDTLSEIERSKVMAKVRSADTKPEWILRCGLHRLGFRYKLADQILPGRPDLVFPKYNAVMFVHGCYWHRHEGCKSASTPKSNTDFWLAKFNENVKRDTRNIRELEALGWRVLVLWECELTNSTALTLRKAAHWLTNDWAARSKRALYKIDRRLLLTVAERKVRYRLSKYQTELTHARAESSTESES